MIRPSVSAGGEPHAFAITFTIDTVEYTVTPLDARVDELLTNPRTNSLGLYFDPLRS